MQVPAVVLLKSPVSTVICPEVGQVTVPTGQVPQVSSTEVRAAAAEHDEVPAQTRMTGSPEHDPMGAVQVDGEVLVVLLHPTVYERPGVHEKVPPRRQLHSREVALHVVVVHGAVGSPVEGTSMPASPGLPVRHDASAPCTEAHAGACGAPEEQSMGADVRHPR